MNLEQEFDEITWALFKDLLARGMDPEQAEQVLRAIGKIPEGEVFKSIYRACQDSPGLTPRFSGYVRDVWNLDSAG